MKKIYKDKRIYTAPSVHISYDLVPDVNQKVVTFITEHSSKEVSYIKGMTLHMAIAAAGGAGTFDSKRYAYIERKGKSKKYDLKIVEHREAVIFPNDVIRLPHSSKDGEEFYFDLDAPRYRDRS